MNSLQVGWLSIAIVTFDRGDLELTWICHIREIFIAKKDACTLVGWE